MEDISLHVMDIVENSIRAGATEVAIDIREDEKRDLLEVEIRDNGEGMDEDMKRKALDPFYTSKENKRVGLGIPLLMQSAREGGGTFALDSKPKGGTKITATFVLSHPDRKPLGDLDGTVQILRFTHPEIQFLYEYRKNTKVKE
jgi:signal transduction histidine kinase